MWHNPQVGISGVCRAVFVESSSEVKFCGALDWFEYLEVSLPSLVETVKCAF